MARVSQALPSLIDGVTKQEPEVTDRKYMADMLNMQVNTGTGLSRREGTTLVQSGLKTDSGTLAFDNTKDFVKAFQLRSKQFYMRFRTTLPIENRADDDVIVFDLEGNVFDVTMSAGAYKYIAENGDRNSVHMNVHGDTAFITVDTVQTKMLTNIRTATPDTMIRITRAPLLGEVLSVIVTTQAGAVLPVSITVGVNTADNSVSKVANDLAVGLASHTELGISVLGATIVITDVTDNAAVTISVSDEDVIDTIGDEVEEITQLTRNGIIDKVVAIRKTGAPDKTVIYMRSEGSPESTAVKSSGTITMIATNWFGQNIGWGTGSSAGGGSLLDWQGLKVTGVSHLENNTTQQPARVFLQTPEVETLPQAQHIQRLIIINKETRAIVLDSTTTFESNTSGLPFTTPSNFKTDTVYPPGTLQAGIQYDIYLNPLSVPSFGTAITQVVWKETSALNEPFRIDTDTMPVQLVPQDAGGGIKVFNLTQAEWSDKRAGNSENNPEPEFIGRTIRGLEIFQNRLLALSDDNVTLSETGNTINFFRDTVSQQVATDPINIRSTSNAAARFEYAVNHNKDLLLFTEKQNQYKLAGNIPLTPNNAGLPQVSGFASESGIKPISLGDKVYYAFSYGESLGINAHRIDPDSNIDTADAITEHVVGLIPKDIESISGNASSGDLVVSERGGSIYMYNFDRDAENSRAETTRGAWYKWGGLNGELPYTIETLTMNKTTLNIVIARNNQLDIVNLEIEKDNVSPGKIHIDNAVEVTSNATGLITLPENYLLDTNAKLIVSNTDLNIPLYDIPYTTLGTQPETLQVNIVIEPDTANAVFVLGTEFQSHVIPQKILPRDQGGRINSSRHTNILRWLVYLLHSADINAVVSNPFAPDTTQYWSGLVSGNINTLTSTVANTSSIFKVSYKQPGNIGSLKLESNGYLGMNITELEWLGSSKARGTRF